MPTINGTAGNDTLNGTIDDDIINGLDGNDTIYGDAGRDTIDGGAGDDTILGGLGDDVITDGAGSDTRSEAPDGAVWKFDYNERGDLVHAVDPVGHERFRERTADRLKLSDRLGLRSCAP